MHNLVINHKQQPINGQPSGLKPSKKLPIKQPLFWVISSLVAIIFGTMVLASIWYNVQLSPVGNDVGQLKKITIAAGSTSAQIGKQLQKQSIIRNATAFDIYVRLSGKNNVLKAGAYRLSPAESVPQIVEHFVNGSVDQYSITFYPGATLIDKTDKAKSKKYDVTTVLENAGFSDQEITDALAKTYDSPLFAGKPTGASLEGYIYGETYNFSTGSTVEDILNRTFTEFYSVIQKNNLVEGFSRQGLDLYQGITLASIVQREVNSPKDQTKPSQDQKQVAQVFFTRLDMGMMLGSDVTYQYVADKNGVARDVNIDSKYNTRRYAGLPPGPIASPSLSALLAVAQPAEGDYIYFLSGDDDVTYFARTNDEHEANIANHCKIKCITQ